MTRVAILDYGMGNLRSVGKALEHVGAEPFLTSDHARVREAEAIVLPGVGAMPKAMERVRELALDHLLRGPVDALEAPGLKVPQIGWNPVSWLRDSPLIAGLPAPCAFYHANSFAPRPTDDDAVLGTAEYGTEFVSVVERAPVYGLQSHPEKSGPDGLRLLKNFVSLASAPR